MANYTHKSHAVYVKSSWADAWQLVPYLYANRFSIAVAPNTQSAILEYSYGRILRNDANILANYTPLDLTDKYVKIAVDGGYTWYGVCIDDDNQRAGEAVHAGNSILTGKQLFQCRGLEYLLQREPVLSSVVSDGNGGEQTIGRAIGFNLGAGLPGSGYREPNAGLVLGARNTAIFTSDLQQSTSWQSHMILQYLLAYMFPRNGGGLDVIGWTVDSAIARQHLSMYKPTLQIHGKTIFQILNELIDRRRLLAWWIYVNPANEVPEIRIFSFNSANIALPDGNILIANQDQASWNFDRENRVQVCQLATDTSAKYDRVYVKGEPPGSCFTLQGSGGGGNNLLEIDWTTDQQTAYRAGATAAAGYGGLNSWDRHNANQTARTKDSLKKVFSYFRINPTTFTGTIGGNPVWPYGNADALERAIPLSFWLPGIRLQDKLPLRLEHDYTNVEAVTNEMKQKSKWEYQRPFAYMKDENDKYYFLDRAGRGEEVDTHIQAAGRFWSANVRMQDDAPGVIISVSGAPQHIIAKNTFTPIDDDDATDYTPDADYNYMGVTVFAEGDGNVTVVYPTAPVVAGDTIKDLIIFAPHCRLDYIVPNTVIDIDNEGDLVLSSGGFVQDDTPYMRNVARSSYEWYRQARRAMQVTIHELAFIPLVNQNAQATTVSPGVLLLNIGNGVNLQAANSVVSAVECDLLAGTTTYTTQFAELDLT